MTGSDAARPAALRIAIEVSDRFLAERLEALLSRADGIELVKPDATDVDAIVGEGAKARPAGDVRLGLTQREREVLALLAEGASNKMAGRQLGISAHTAKFHVRQLMDKLDAVSRTDAVAHAARLGALML